MIYLNVLILSISLVMAHVAIKDLKYKVWVLQNKVDTLTEGKK